MRVFTKHLSRNRVFEGPRSSGRPQEAQKNTGNKSRTSLKLPEKITSYCESLPSMCPKSMLSKALERLGSLRRLKKPCIPYITLHSFTSLQNQSISQPARSPTCILAPYFGVHIASSYQTFVKKPTFRRPWSVWEATGASIKKIRGTNYERP